MSKLTYAEYLEAIEASVEDLVDDDEIEFGGFYDDEAELYEARVTGTIKKDPRSAKYVDTIKNDEHRKDKLAALRAKHGSVGIKGRLGERSPHAKDYKAAGSYRNIKVNHASHFDVYKRGVTKEAYDALDEEQLDELSHGKLSAYVSKAKEKNWGGSDEGGPRLTKDLLKKGNKRSAGIRKAVSKLTSEETEVVEDTVAADSLHPAARGVSDDKALDASKVEMMKHVVDLMGDMNKNGMVDFFNSVQSQFGPGKTYGVGDNSDKNKSSINMKPSSAIGSGGPSSKDPMPKLDGSAATQPASMLGKRLPDSASKMSKINAKEDVEEMLAGQELSEEFRDKVTTLFEAAVGARIGLEIARLEEEVEAFAEELADSYDQELDKVEEQLKADLDQYLDYVTDRWMEENQVAVESTLRNEIVEEFIEGLKGLFAEHYIDVPQDKVDVLEALTNKVAELEEKFSDVIAENKDLKTKLVESEMVEIFADMAEDLTMQQREKFSTLVEGIEFNGDLDTFSKKLAVVKETYFKKGSGASTNITEETFETEDSQTTVNVDEKVNRYVEALNKSVKR